MAGFSDAFFMQKALEQANLAYEKDEVPVGAILVKNNEVLSAAHNLSITKNDPSAHAEILCLKEAGKVLNNYRLLGTTLYVTLEPCMMCAGASQYVGSGTFPEFARWSTFRLGSDSG